MSIFKRYRSYCVYVFLLIFLLSVFGIISVYSASSVYAYLKYNNIAYFFLKQSIFATVGLIGCLLIWSLNSRIIEKYIYCIYFVIFMLLILVHFIGVGAVEAGARSWIRFAGIGIQPSELVKFLYPCYFGYMMKARGFDIRKNKISKVVFNILLLILPVLLVLAEPDIGTAAILFCELAFMCFFTPIPMYIFGALGGTSVLGAIIILKKASLGMNRLNRLKAFINPWSDPKGIGYHIIQSYYAIANGGLLGLGIGNSKQKYMWLPEQHTDFIFSIIGEETGLWGTAFIILCFVLLFIFCALMYVNIKDEMAKYVILGIGFVIVFQAFLNISISVGLFPVTGITLPFISYGGSSIVCDCISVGIMLSFYQDSLDFLPMEN